MNKQLSLEDVEYMKTNILFRRGKGEQNWFLQQKNIFLYKNETWIYIYTINNYSIILKNK